MGLGTKSEAAASAPQAQPPQPASAVASTVGREISTIESQVVEAAEAMPEDKFNFSPESLNIPGGDYKSGRADDEEVSASPFVGSTHLGRG